MDEKPKLRMLEVFPAEIQGQKTICLRDPEKLTDGIMFMTELGFYFIQMMDGENTLADIQADYSRRFGAEAPLEQIEGLVEQLDESYFLENERYLCKHEQVRDEYAACESRPCSHAGVSYPEDPGELRKVLDGYFQKASSDPEMKKVEVEKVRGIMAPHIDLKHGGPCFAGAYNFLRHRKPDVFVIFGVGHNASNNLFTVESRAFETPLGSTPVDRQAMDVLRRRLGDSIFEEDFIHRIEHSIEFQVVFLQHILGSEQAPIIPVLCTSFHEMILKGRDPAESEKVREFQSALEEAVGGRDACYIAGVDLAHVGMKFGDIAAPGETLRKHIRREDMAMLSAVEAVDAPGFFNSVAKDHDTRRICGMSAMYMFLTTSGAKSGSLLKYEQMIDEQTGSLVSYAGMVFS